MTDQSVPQPGNADPQNLTGTVSGAATPVPETVQLGATPDAPQQPTPPVAETHTTVTLDGVEHTISDALTVLGARNSIVQQIEAYVQTYGREAAGWLHRIVDLVSGNLPPAS